MNFVRGVGYFPNFYGYPPLDFRSIVLLGRGYLRGIWWCDQVRMQEENRQIVGELLNLDESMSPEARNKIIQKHMKKAEKMELSSSELGDLEKEMPSDFFEKMELLECFTDNSDKAQAVQSPMEEDLKCEGVGMPWKLEAQKMNYKEELIQLKPQGENGMPLSLALIKIEKKIENAAFAKEDAMVEMEVDSDGVINVEVEIISGNISVKPRAEAVSVPDKENVPICEGNPKVAVKLGKGKISKNFEKEEAKPASKVVKEGAKPELKVVNEEAKPTSKIVMEVAKPASKVVNEEAKPTSKVVKEVAKPASKVVKEVAKTASKIVMEGAKPAVKVVKEGGKSAVKVVKAPEPVAKRRRKRKETASMRRNTRLYAGVEESIEIGRNSTERELAFKKALEAIEAFKPSVVRNANVAPVRYPSLRDAILCSVRGSAKKFKCPHCHHAFQQRYKWVSHVKIHIGKFLHSCACVRCSDVTYRDFRTMRKHHNDAYR